MRQKSEQIGDEQPLCEMGGILGLQRYDSEHRIDDHEQQIGEYLAAIFEYYGAAEPPVRCGESHLSGLTEPPHFVY